MVISVQTIQTIQRVITGLTNGNIRTIPGTGSLWGGGRYGRYEGRGATVRREANTNLAGVVGGHVRRPPPPGLLHRYETGHALCHGDGGPEASRLHAAARIRITSPFPRPSPRPGCRP